MKMWLKGGLIGIILVVIYIIFISLWTLLFYSAPSEVGYLWMASPYLLLGGFVLGALIGLIFNKIKKPKNKRKKWI
ncbi:MAG: hypothetical protein WC533_02790 [Candidatus Pacearchaeota archaeon]